MSARQTKRQALRDSRALHPEPQRVRASLFADHPFFDPEDKVQVKYEMLRQREVDGAALRATCGQFGFSRESYRKMLARFQTEGFAGLFEKKRGRKQALKATSEVVAFLLAERATDPEVSVKALAERVAVRFDVIISPRTIHRALASQSGQKKKARR